MSSSQSERRISTRPRTVRGRWIEHGSAHRYHTSSCMLTRQTTRRQHSQEGNCPCCTHAAAESSTLPPAQRLCAAARRHRTLRCKLTKQTNLTSTPSDMASQNNPCPHLGLGTGHRHNWPRGSQPWCESRHRHRTLASTRSNCPSQTPRSARGMAAGCTFRSRPTNHTPCLRTPPLL
jgi:hypothetical protein